MPMTLHDAEIKITRLIDGQTRMEEEIAAANAKIAALEDERNKALKWGVLSLGSAVLAMGYWIFNKVIGGHIQ
jgi:hypothetical protein